MPKLMVAGCSFSAPSQSAPGTSWGEVMAKELGWDLVHLARQGVSNGGIRIMMDEILRQRPDFAVITPTFWDRMEIPAESAPFDWSQQTQGWDPPLQRHLQNVRIGNGYDRDLGMSNVNYGDQPSRMISETIFSLAENFPHPYRSAAITKTAQTAIRHWIDGIYDSNWKKQQDEWIIREGVFQLFHAGIRFLLVPCLLWPWDPTRTTLWRDSFPTAIPDEYLMLDESQSPLSVAGQFPFQGEDPGYHMSEQGQRHIAHNYVQRWHRDHAT